MSFVMRYPFNHWTETVTLPNPIFGNSDGYGTPFQFKITEDGAVKSNLSGDIKSRLVYTFNKILKADIINLEDFIDLSIGEEIRVVDHNNDQWQVKLVSNPINVTQGSDGACGLHQLVLEFEGTKV